MYNAFVSSFIILESQAWNPLSWDNAPLMAVVGALWVIVMLRANATYWLGRAIAKGTSKTRLKEVMESKHYATAQRWLNRWGAPAVTVSFLTIGIQTMVNMGAGMLRMPLRRYLPAVAIGCVLWAFMYGTIGFIGFVAVEQLWAFSPALTIVLGVLLVGTIVGYIMVGRRDKRQVEATEAAAAESDSSAADVVVSDARATN